MRHRQWLSFTSPRDPVPYFCPCFKYLESKSVSISHLNHDDLIHNSIQRTVLDQSRIWPGYIFRPLIYDYIYLTFVRSILLWLA